MEQTDVNVSQNTRTNSGVIEIDLSEIVGILIHRLWLIAIVAIGCAVAGFAFSKFVLPEEFRSTTKIYVLDKDNADSSSIYTDLQVGSQLTKDYAELIKSRYVLESVIDTLGIGDRYDYDDFLEKVSVNTPADTRIVAITVTDTDPYTAQTMANYIREVSAEHIENVMDIDAVNVVEVANLPTEKSAPSCILWTLGGFALGAVLVSALLIIHFLVDDTVKTSEDVERYLGISALGIIPFDENVTQDIGSQNGKSNKKSRKHGRSGEISHIGADDMDDSQTNTGS
ncbi:Capsular polysaccharide biosynthesis protein [Butyrivibrio fibrisolvens DSM 3071]|uniref:Capsular polysaccharide biosynthesis protein n=1 Tax=Butyrivibrio fibrisolvens DSM 3071 TaxID=1121131 RepID=A0A1M5Z7X7_BUTFI|nr:Wzz/FepE/Etk N-terminal domain-containing protein [Butyrivibrio fibrisolvens]SHI20349.1 Capsular polysaccharide biosynthesis protein [Butyrivibrio fibrisolvens DSM 3071]